MRDKVRDMERLSHILHAIENIERFQEGKTREDFVYDSMLFHAVVNNLCNLGEAAYKLTHEFRESHPGTEWKNIIGMRHYLVHGYYQVSLDIIWETVTDDLRELKHQIQNYIKEQ